MVDDLVGFSPSFVKEPFLFGTSHTYIVDLSYTPCFRPPQIEIKSTMRVVNLLSDDPPFKRGLPMSHKTRKSIKTKEKGEKR